MTFTNCVFDLEGTSNLIRPFYVTGKNGNAHTNVYVNGGKIILSTKDKFEAIYRPSGQTSGSVTFGKNAKGEYTAILVDQGTTAPTQTVTLDNGMNGGFGYSETKNGKDVYVIGFAVETPYGTIPAAYSNAEKYPFVVFKKDGTFFGAYTCLFGNTDTNNGGDLSIIAMHGARSAGDGAVILMRNDWTYTDSVSYPNIGNNSGTVTLDLNGFTIYDKHGYTGGLFILRSKKSPTENTLVVKNGTILIGGKNSVVSCIEHSNSITDTVLNVIFDGVTFGYMAGGTSNVVIVRDYKPTNNLGYNVTLKNCTVDLTNAPNGTKLVDLGTGVVNVKVEGLTVKGDTNNTTGMSITPKHSVSLYSDFLYTVYIPVVNGINYIEIDGERYTDLSSLAIELIDGNAYYKLEKRINPFGAYTAVELAIGITLSDGTDAVGEWSIGVIEYIKTVAEDADTVNSTLAKDMLSYVAAAYNFFAPTSEEAKAVAKLATEMLGVGYDGANMPTPAEKKQSTDGLDSAALMIDGAPAFVFYPETDENGNLVYAATDYRFAVGGTSVNGEIHTSSTGKTYILVKVSAYRMIENITYTVDGTDISGEYNLSAYLEFAKGDAALESLCLRLMKYAESAEAYRAKNS